MYNFVLELIERMGALDADEENDEDNESLHSEPDSMYGSDGLSDDSMVSLFRQEAVYYHLPAYTPSDSDYDLVTFYTFKQIFRINAKYL